MQDIRVRKHVKIKPSSKEYANSLQWEIERLKRVNDWEYVKIKGQVQDVVKDNIDKILAKWTEVKAQSVK